MSEAPASLERFTGAERWVHRTTGLLMGTCLVTAFVLYYGPVSLAVGHRHTVELVHVWAGYALAAPLLLGLLSSAYRADLRVLNRFAGRTGAGCDRRTGATARSRSASSTPARSSTPR